ncbi:MAG: riboflavin synthase [Proteobacteria bacterium]|nr:riboflavin synthase [Pseudomonadota bacterium]
MFTGIVEHVGRVTAIEPGRERTVLALDVGPVAEGVSLGDSIAVNGCCLTATEIRGSELRFDAVQETLDRTNLGDLEVGSRVHLERALRAGERFDGHMVQGHIDATGRVRSVEARGDDVRFAVDCDPSLAELLVDKGSVAIDGVSLTVVHAEAEGFDVALIPHTLKETILGDRKPGERVNLEADVLGKYVKRYLERMLPRS